MKYGRNYPKEITPYPWDKNKEILWWVWWRTIDGQFSEYVTASNKNQAWNFIRNKIGGVLVEAKEVLTEEQRKRRLASNVQNY